MMYLDPKSPLRKELAGHNLTAAPKQPNASFTAAQFEAYLVESGLVASWEDAERVARFVRKSSEVFAHA
ncbi:hypothetical protein [Rhizobium sp. BG4]|uniref:hypothetical protein n=1 Tax=Rhizobium sp. BG4 TaxID=2613770 RepID=UPI00193D1650|nr:hypothetical protein [Rhizobium sp. BG4]QRM45346.1 hypothetical protein F2982_19010 [Rhizobium sp. BG4]